MDRKTILKKTVITAFIINTIQVLSSVGIIIFYVSRNGDIKKEVPLFIALIIVIIMSFFISIRDAYNLNRYDKDQGALEDSMKRLESLNNTLRAQRHDFLNHLQVVYGLMEMEEFKEARDYIDKVYNDIQKVSQALKTSSPAINALLQAKLLYCENRGIVLKINITSKIQKLPLPAWEFCRILGNLIDNSIFALQEISSIKWIEVVISEDDSLFKFNVSNNGPEIPEKIREKIFDAGFTTKGVLGEGMGLSIVKSLIDSYHGNLYLHSDKQKTIFECIIPKICN